MFGNAADHQAWILIVDNSATAADIARQVVAFGDRQAHRVSAGGAKFHEVGLWKRIVLRSVRVSTVIDKHLPQRLLLRAAMGAVAGYSGLNIKYSDCE